MADAFAEDIAGGRGRGEPPSSLYLYLLKASVGRHHHHGREISAQRAPEQTRDDVSAADDGGVDTIIPALSSSYLLGVPRLRRRVLSFWSQLKQSLASKSAGSLSLYSDEARRLWLECWTAVAQGDRDFAPPHILLEILLILPSSAQNFPSVTLVVQVVSTVLSQLKDRRSNRLPVEEQLKHLSTIARVFRDRPQGVTPDCRNDKAAFLSTLGNIKSDFEEVVCMLLTEKSSAEVRRSVRETMGRLSDIEAYEAFAGGVNFVDESAVDLLEKPWLGWIHAPTVGWLTSPTWLDFPPLRSSYQSSDEYVETLTRVWTALTFYWGAGALWPSCYFRRGEDIACGQPMLHGCSGSGMHCSARDCTNLAKWSCYHYGHDSICGSCLRRKQDGILGPPSKLASTDVYDGVVTRESCRRDGNVFHVSDFQSRRPPAIAPNWSTSYRLPVAGLVAVVRLDTAK